MKQIQASTNLFCPNYLTDKLNNLLLQSMNMDLYHKMAAVYRQHMNLKAQPTSSPSQSNHDLGD